MAYTLQAVPLPLNITTTPEVSVELTAWEKVQAWFSNDENLAYYVILPSLCSIYGGFIFLYIVHRLRVAYRRSKRRRRAEEKAAGFDNSALIEDGDGSRSSSPYINRISGPISLTYHDSTSVPNATTLYPIADRATLHPPRPQVAQSKGPIKKMTKITTRPKTQIIMRCRCESTVHNPGCPKFNLPDIRFSTKSTESKNPLTASTSEVSVTLKEAMDKVATYEHELKTNPAMQALLNKYRELKKEATQKKWDENAQKGNWQQVPIAQLLERKKKQKDGTASSMY